MAAFSFDIAPLMQVSKDIQRIGENVRKNESKAVKLAAQAYVNDVKAIAPLGTDPKTGPHGTYRKSIHAEPSTEGGHPVAFVGTDLKYGRRLEYGFFEKTDRLGRTFHQFPRPHFRPAFDHNLPKYEKIITDVIRGATAEMSTGRTLFNYTDYFDSSRIVDDIVNEGPLSRTIESVDMEPVTVQKAQHPKGWKPGTRYVGDW